MKTKYSIWNGLWLWEDDGYRKEYLIELNKYLKSKLPQYKVDEYPKECCFDHWNDSERCRYKHFIDFCKLKRIDPYVAHRLFTIHRCIDCDCQYLHEMEVAEDSHDTKILEHVKNPTQRR